MRIAIYDLREYRKAIGEATKKGELSNIFTIEHLHLSVPHIKFNGPILQKMRICGMLDKVCRNGKLTEYSLSDKYYGKNK